MTQKRYSNDEVNVIVNILSSCNAAPQFFTHPSQKGKFIWLNNPPEGRCSEIRKRPYMLDGRRWDLFTGSDNAYSMIHTDGIIFLVCLDRYGKLVPDMRFAFSAKHI